MLIPITTSVVGPVALDCYRIAPGVLVPTCQLTPAEAERHVRAVARVRTIVEAAAVSPLRPNTRRAQ